MSNFFLNVHVATPACKVVALLPYYRQSENENKIKFLKVVKYYFNVFFTTRSNRFLNYTSHLYCLCSIKLDSIVDLNNTTCTCFLQSNE